jgi:hypothetical protein
MAAILAGYREDAPAQSLHSSVGSGPTLRETLETFRQDYAPVLRISIPRRRRRASEPQSPFLKQR